VNIPATEEYQEEKMSSVSDKGKPETGGTGEKIKKANESVTKEISNLTIEQKIGKVKLSWDLDVPDVDHIEIFGRYRKDENYWKIDSYPNSVRSVELKLLPLAPIDIKIHLIFKNGVWSEGKIISTSALHKKVVYDEIEGRSVHIYLPDGYHEEDRVFPVIYMHDGQNLFCEKLAFVEDWQVDRSMDRLIANGKIEKTVVVGIFNSTKRAEEYTPFADRRFGGGQARDFSEFIVNKIVPHIEKNYKVSGKREDRAVMGSSFGGILSLWMGYTYPEVFSMVGAISPSMWIADGAMLEELERQPRKNIRIWIDQGTKEWSTFTRNTVDVLISKGYEYGKDLVYYEVKDGKHNEVDWAERVECPFIMFKGKPATKCTDLRLDIQVVRKFSVGDPEVVINPIGSFDNGMWYSLYTSAYYYMSGIGPAGEVLGKMSSSRKIKAGVDNTGVVNFNGDREASIKVRYGNIIKMVTVKNPVPPERTPEERKPVKPGAVKDQAVVTGPILSYASDKAEKENNKPKKNR
jgi:predicted alpha/beta superfamily hydrolase